jgi:hypothetical protein
MSIGGWAQALVLLGLATMALGCGFLGGLVDLVKDKAETEEPSGPPIDLSNEVLYVSASTAVADFKGYSFQPAMLHDGNISTCWQESNKDTPGGGESFTVSFARPVDITQIRIANGCQNHSAGKYGDLFSTNSRPRSLRIAHVSDGAVSTTNTSWTLRDQVGWQTLEVSLKGVQELRFHILDAYLGSKWQDASVSEVAFMGRPSGEELPEPALTTGRYCYQSTSSGQHLVGDVNISGRRARWMVGEASSDNLIIGEGVVTATGVFGMTMYMAELGKPEHSEDRLSVNPDRLIARATLNRSSCQAIDGR